MGRTWSPPWPGGWRSRSIPPPFPRVRGCCAVARSISAGNGSCFGPATFVVAGPLIPSDPTRMRRVGRDVSKEIWKRGAAIFSSL